MGDKIKLTQNWCLTEDRTRVVSETDVAARWLHWIKGQEVDLAEAIRLGAVRKKTETVKMRPAPANKQARKPANKGGW